eukprot:g8520.t1
MARRSPLAQQPVMWDGAWKWRRCSGDVDAVQGIFRRGSDGRLRCIPGDLAAPVPHERPERLNNLAVTRNGLLGHSTCLCLLAAAAACFPGPDLHHRK